MSRSQSDDPNTLSDRDMERHILLTPESSLPLTNRITPNQSDIWDTGSDTDMRNQVSFSQESPSFRKSRSTIKVNQSNNSNTGSDKDMDNLSLFTPERSSNANSRIKQNNHMTQTQALTKIWQIKVYLHQKDHQVE